MEPAESRRKVIEFSASPSSARTSVLVKGVYLVDSSPRVFSDSMPTVITRLKEAGVERVVVVYHSLVNDLRKMMEKTLDPREFSVKFLKISYGLTKYLFKDAAEGEVMGSQMASEIYAETGAFDNTVFVIIGFGFLVLRDKHGPNERITSEFWKSLIFSLEPLNTGNFTVLYDKDAPVEMVSILRPLSTGIAQIDEEGSGYRVRIVTYDQ